MVDIQSPTAEIRRGNKKRRKKKQDENIMVCPVAEGDHNKDHIHCLSQTKLLHSTKAGASITIKNMCTLTVQ